MGVELLHPQTKQVQTDPIVQYMTNINALHLSATHALMMPTLKYEEENKFSCQFFSDIFYVDLVLWVSFLEQFQ